MKAWRNLCKITQPTTGGTHSADWPLKEKKTTTKPNKPTSFPKSGSHGSSFSTFWHFRIIYRAVSCVLSTHNSDLRVSLLGMFLPVLTSFVFPNKLSHIKVMDKDLWLHLIKNFHSWSGTAWQSFWKIKTSLMLFSSQERPCWDWHGFISALPTSGFSNLQQEKCSENRDMGSRWVRGKGVWVIHGKLYWEQHQRPAKTKNSASRWAPGEDDMVRDPWVPALGMTLHCCSQPQEFILGAWIWVHTTHTLLKTQRFSTRNCCTEVPSC